MIFVEPDQTYDVVVIGGGAAGIAASAAAARAGARTALVESGETLGGVVANALVHTICGLFAPLGDGEPRHVHRGLPRAFAEKLEKHCGAVVARAQDATYLMMEPADFVATAEDLCESSANLKVLRRHELVGVNLARSASETSDLTLRCGDSQRVLRARAVVDTSGDATAAALGGAGLMQAAPAALQYPSYVFRLAGVRTDDLDPLECARTSAVVARASRHDKLPLAAESIVLRPGIRDGDVFVTLNVDKPDPDGYDPLDERCTGAMLADARDAAREIAALLIAERAPFANARLGEQARRLGIRETRRAEGRVVLDVRSVLEGRRTDDEVCCSSWPVELWTSHRKLSFRRVSAPCSIVLGSLQSVSHPRLAMAGRCVSADREALGAVRVIATSMATGEAAGFCAAIAVDAGVSLEQIAPGRVRRAIEKAAEHGWPA